MELRIKPASLGAMVESILSWQTWSAELLETWWGCRHGRRRSRIFAGILNEVWVGRQRNLILLQGVRKERAQL